jgi:hypothetical protein
MCRYATDLLPMLKLLVLPEWKARLQLDEQVNEGTWSSFTRYTGERSCAYEQVSEGIWSSFTRFTGERTCDYEQVSERSWSSFTRYTGEKTCAYEQVSEGTCHMVFVYQAHR